MPEDDKPDRGTVWLDKDLLKKARTIGAAEDKSIMQVLEESLRGPLEKRLRKVAEKMTVELGESGA